MEGSVIDYIQRQLNTALSSDLFTAGAGITLFHFLINHGNKILKNTLHFLLRTVSRKAMVNKYNWTRYSRWALYICNEKPIFSTTRSYTTGTSVTNADQYIPTGVRAFIINRSIVVFKIDEVGDNGTKNSTGSGMDINVATRFQLPDITAYILFRRGSTTDILNAIDKRAEKIEETHFRDQSNAVHLQIPGVGSIDIHKYFPSSYEYSSAHKYMDEMIAKFLRDREISKRKNRKYTDGFLLLGPHGNGKSSAIKWVASRHNLRLMVLDLKNVDLGSFRDSIFSLADISTDASPRIVMCEDVDTIAITNNRASTPGSTPNYPDDMPITLSDLLNMMDGVFSPENIIWILTTNHPEKLDPALLRRGRINHHIRFDNPDYEFLAALAAENYEKPIEEMRKIVSEYDDLGLISERAKSLADIGYLFKQCPHHHDFFKRYGKDTQWG